MSTHRKRIATYSSVCWFVAMGIAIPAIASQDLHRLDTKVVPTQQSVRLRLDADQPSYSGTVTIRLEVQEQTREFRLHGEDMTLQRALLRGPKGKLDVTHESTGTDLLRFTTKKPLQPGTHTLEIDFESPFNTQAVGLYRMEQEGQGYAFTQFEAADARKAFPCFDEPGFKFPWQLTISVPEKHIAVTNTPVAKTTVAEGWRTYAFRESKPLPSYLIAIAAGPLVETPIPGLSVPGRIVTLPGQEKWTGLAVETTPPILAAIEKYFGSAYPYEKLDLIAIPEYWPGAMEHPGAVTYAANILLVDPTAASVSQRRTLVRVTSHELAHMWFGNLVTMEWWDDLWLNESFADWLGDKIAHQVYPQYNLAISELQSSMRIMSGDARPSAQAIRQPVESTDNLLQNVGVQYNKGKAVLGMIESWIGSENFRTGVLAYLEEHEWGNARAEDFWKALEYASSPGVTRALSTFIEQPGLPLVRVDIESDGQVRLSQTRFTNYGVDQPALRWIFPVTLKYSDGRKVHEKTVVLDTESTLVDLGGKPAWVLPNADQRGYYRWVIAGDDLTKLTGSAGTTLNERERVGFLNNLSALLDAGVVRGDDFLMALGDFANDPKPSVIGQLLSTLDKVEQAFVPQELENAFASYVRSTLGPALERFGAEPRAAEDEEIALLRPRLLSWLGDTGKDTRILDYTTQLAQRYIQDPTSIDATLAGVALRQSAIRGDRALFDDYCQRFESAKVPADRSRFLQAIGSFRDRPLMEDALRYALSGPLRPNEFFHIPGSMTSTREGRDYVFQWITENYAQVVKNLPPPVAGFMPFIASGCSATRLEAAREFFAKPENQVPGTDIQLAKVSDQVQDCVSLREREGDAVAAFLTGKAGGERMTKPAGR